MSRPVAQADPPAEMSLLPRVAAVARDAAEVVRFAGGWLFDKALAGWDVNVLTLDGGDPRSLRILGAHLHDLAPLLESPVPLGQCLGAIAVPGDLYRSDAGVRELADNALESAPGELLLWGDEDVPTDPSEHPWIHPHLLRPPVPVRHRLSFAALAFKAQALAAVRVPDPSAVLGDAESFRSVRVG